MIDIENEVFTANATALRTAYTGIDVSGEYNPSPAVIPHVSISENDNFVYQKSLTSSATENHASLMYEVNVYTNAKTGKKAQAKAILAVVDTVMLGLGFVRTSSRPIPNYNDATIYRIVARYEAVASKTKQIFRR